MTNLETWHHTTKTWRIQHQLNELLRESCRERLKSIIYKSSQHLPPKYFFWAHA